MTSNETNQENNMKSYLIRESEKVFLSLSPVSVLFSIRSLTEKKTLKKELKWAKQSNGLMPETEEEIPVEGTVGGKAVKEGVSKDEAEKVMKQLTDVGANVELK